MASYNPPVYILYSAPLQNYVNHKATTTMVVLLWFFGLTVVLLAVASLLKQELSPYLHPDQTVVM